MANGIAGTSNGPIGWFIAGAVVIAAAIGIYLYADGYFDKDSVELNLGPAKIEIQEQ